MATILTKEDSNYLEPVFPSIQNEASSYNGEASFCIEKILIKTDKYIYKEGGNIYIEGEKINIEKMTILDLCILLRNKKIKTSFIDNVDYNYYPALCLRDFSNLEQRSIQVYSSPYKLSPLKQILNLNTTPYDDLILTIDNVHTQELKKLEYKLSSGLIFIPNITSNTFITYSVFTSEFSIKLDFKFSSSSLETVSRYLDVN